MNLTELQQMKGSLRRAPPPKAPPNKASLPRNIASPNTDNLSSITQSITGVKLKPTGFRASLIADDGDFKAIGHADDDEPENELLRKIKQRRALVEQTEQKEEEEIKPRPKPKPKPKPHLESKENERKLSSSSDDSAKENKENSIDVNRNVVCRDSRGEPKLSFLPTLESLGKPPAKPIKVEGLEKLLQKYSRADIMIAQRRSTLTRNNESSIGTTALDNVIAEDDEFVQEDYDDVDEDLKAQILGKAASGEQEVQPTSKEEDSGILEENYDDVDEIKQKVNEINQNIDGAQNAEPICEESYDDLDTVAEQVQLQLKNDFSVEGETFGEEMYEALPGEDNGVTNGISNGVSNGISNGSSVNNGFDSPVENKFSPSATPSAQVKEKGKKDLRKEIEVQKKKEREEQKRKKEEEKRRDKEEREERKRKEEEKKRKEEEKKKREREVKELRKKHKLKPGNEGSGVGEAKSNFAGDGKFELPAKEGETLVIISEKGCPSGKWLVKNTEGHLGYIPTELIQLKIDSDGNRLSAVITEDFYEDVDKYQSAGQIEEEADNQEVYDDIAGQEPIDEDLYEELPADQ